MTEEELAAIEAREQAATKGPWVCQEVGGRPECGEMYGPVARKVGSNGWASAPIFTCGNLDEDDAANFSFLLHARQDVPALTAEVRRLRRLLGGQV